MVRRVYYNGLNTSTVQNIAIATGIGKIELDMERHVNYKRVNIHQK
jgi:hypothetical protein